MDILEQSKHILMEDPKTRRQSKKTAKEKKGEKYGQKHVRLLEFRKCKKK